MKYCNNCGRPVDERAVYCPYCGRSIPRQNVAYQPGQQPYYRTPNPKDTGSVGWGFLGFLFPVVGLILYLVWESDQPKNAKRAGAGALASVILGVITGIIYFIIFMALILL